MVWIDAGAAHCARIPSDLPMELAPLGPCLCNDCTSSDPRLGVAFHQPRNANRQGERAMEHTNDWRRLSWELGDAAASWVCGYCDRHRNPAFVLDVILTIAEAPGTARLVPTVGGDPIAIIDHARRRVWRYLVAMERA